MKIQAVKWADFAVSGCLKFGFLVTIRNTRLATVQSLSAMFKFVKHFGIRIILTKQDKPITEARTLSRTANNGYRQNHSQLSTS